MTEEISTKVKSYLIELRTEFNNLLIKIKMERYKSNILTEIEGFFTKNKPKLQEIITVLNVFISFKW